MAEMTHRERVLAAVNHREPDRVPIDFGIQVTSIQINAYRELKKHLGVRGGEEMIINRMMMTAKPDEEVLRRFRVDTRHVRPRPARDWQKQEDGDYLDEFGIRWRLSPQGYYHEMVGHPLRDATIEDLERHPFPDPHDPIRTAGLEEAARELYEHSPYCVVLDAFPEVAFGFPSWLRGHQQFYTDLIADQAFAKALIEKLVGYWKGLATAILGKVGKYVHAVRVADDLGTQVDTIISPELYRKLIKPAQKEIYDHIKSLTDAKILLHSCGSVYKLIDDFIEIGVDCLNPVQVSAVNMESDRLKREFGDRITFWGGGCDTQQVLQFGSPREVEEEVRRRIKDLAPGGGFVFAQVHNIQPGTPPENICTMFDSALKYGKYPIA